MNAHEQGTSPGEPCSGDCVCQLGGGHPRSRSTREEEEEETDIPGESTSVRKQSGVQGSNPSQMRLGKVLQHSMSHCKWRGEQQLFDKRRSNFPWLFNLHLLTVPAESLAQGSPGAVNIPAPPLALDQALCPSWAQGTGLWCPQASQGVGQGMTTTCRSGSAESSSGASRGSRSQCK